jgi:hypothetical protein
MGQLSTSNGALESREDRTQTGEQVNRTQTGEQVNSAQLIRQPTGHFYFAGDRPSLLGFDNPTRAVS